MIKTLMIALTLILLVACSSSESALPTLAQLPTATAAAPTPQAPPINTEITPEAAGTVVLPFIEATETPVPNPGLNFIPTGEATITPTDSFDPAALLVTADTPADFLADLSQAQTTIPDTLRLGDSLNLRGQLTLKPGVSGVAVLTDSNGRSIEVLMDDFTANMGNNQEVAIAGEVVENADSPDGLALRVSRFGVISLSPLETLINAPTAPPFVPPTVTPQE